ncbi:hypothetical protein DSM106972_087300 [Dulcicalothrix desertica PCC 7102]|uniref:Uncharacterized protein n=2 Tax=Dulcicalothrix desertica TaxID=32056 RepID=A0A3S1C766_9CYAN|nr:hypothetical protein [Dulcicalothrix desertica]RUS96543.1 hypothetical protein DSM106972_087300 [Dulcicalothrix desertica PCC 7102]
MRTKTTLLSRALKRNVPLTYSDVTALEKMVYGSEIIESREQFQQVYGAVNIKSFIRTLVGLDLLLQNKHLISIYKNKTLTLIKYAL